MEKRKSFTAEDLAQCIEANHDAVSIPMSVLECMELVAENARILQSALASQRDADKLLEKLHAAERERDEINRVLSATIDDQRKTIVATKLYWQSRSESAESQLAALRAELEELKAYNHSRWLKSQGDC